MQIRVFTITSDKYLWTLKPFSYLFNLYWSELQPVVIVGYNHPDFFLPENYSFFSVDNHNYPPKMWSNALIRFLQSVDDEIFCLLFDDYWLSRTVDHAGISTLADYMINNKDVLRLDLTTDRLHARGDARDARDYEDWGHYDLIITTNDVPYQMSFQPALWNRNLMLSLLEDGMTPWEIEVQTQPKDYMKVLGTRQWPLRYANAILKGKIQMDQIDKIPQPHRDIVKQWIMEDWHADVP